MNQQEFDKIRNNVKRFGVKIGIDTPSYFSFDAPPHWFENGVGGRVVLLPNEEETIHNFQGTEYGVTNSGLVQYILKAITEGIKTSENISYDIETNNNNPFDLDTRQISVYFPEKTELSKYFQKRETSIIEGIFLNEKRLKEVKEELSSLENELEFVRKQLDKTGRITVLNLAEQGKPVYTEDGSKMPFSERVQFIVNHLSSNKGKVFSVPSLETRIKQLGYKVTNKEVHASLKYARKKNPQIKQFGRGEYTWED
jgi:hypothetical protein